VNGPSAVGLAPSLRHLLLWAVVLVGLALLALEWSTVLPAARATARWLYALGSLGYGAVADPLNRLRLETRVPLVAPLVLGLMAATAPCQLSTGAAAIAYVARDGRPGGALERAGAFLAARVLFYAIVGLGVMYAFGGDVTAPAPLLRRRHDLDSDDAGAGDGADGAAREPAFGPRLRGGLGRRAALDGRGGPRGRTWARTCPRPSWCRTLGTRHGW